MTNHKDDSKEKPVYMISVAAKLTGLHPQTLRIYERKRLLNPGRTPKSTRLYSERDIDQLKYIQQLTNKRGVNLAGVKIIMELEDRLDRVNSMVVEMEAQIVQADERLVREKGRTKKHFRRELVLIPKGELMRRR